MLDALRRILEAEPGIAYALLFGSTARGTERADSDADVAIDVFHIAFQSKRSYDVTRLPRCRRDGTIAPV